jgi:hypothetical protein
MCLCTPEVKTMYCGKLNCERPVTTTTASSSSLTLEDVQAAVDSLPATTETLPMIITRQQYDSYSKGYPGGNTKFADDLHSIACSWGFDGFIVADDNIPTQSRLHDAITNFSTAILEHESHNIQEGDGSGVRRISSP